jgi:predicted GIY-YIG superfamily endonuclease
MKGTAYLLHFSQAYKHAKYYVGYATNLSARLEAHCKGNGARLLQVITETAF